MHDTGNVTDLKFYIEFKVTCSLNLFSGKQYSIIWYIFLMDNMEFQHVETDVSTPDNKQTTLKLKQPELEATFKFDDENGQMGASNWNQDLGENVKGVLVDLQQHWLADYQKSREKVLVDTVEKV